MTPFSLLRAASGLSQPEVCAVYGVSISTVKKWESGKRNCPPDVISELSKLVVAILGASDKITESFYSAAERTGLPESISLGVCADDHEAQSLGFPTASAHRMVIALAAAQIAADGVKVLTPYRGTTTATAAATDRH